MEKHEITSTIYGGVIRPSSKKPTNRKMKTKSQRKDDKIRYSGSMGVMLIQGNFNNVFPVNQI
jgi:hypothetical protein